MRVGEAVAPLRRRPFAWFYAAEVVSTTGSAMAPIALAFAVLDLTGSASALGLVLAARTVPMVVFMLVGGVISDRFSRSAVLLYANLLSALTQGSVAALVLTGSAEIWMLVALEAANGTFAAFTMPARDSIVPQLAPREELQQANALLGFSFSGLTVLGPSVAAVLVAFAGSGWALAADAVSWLLAAALLTRVRTPRLRAAGASPSVLRDLRDGWSAFVGTTWLWVVVAGFAVINAIYAGGWLTLGPAIADATFGVRNWGYVVSAQALGLLVASLVMLRVRLERPLLTGMAGIALFGLPLLVLGLWPQVGPLVAVAFLSGLGVQVFDIAWSLSMQENIEEGMLSRAYSYDSLGSFAAMPVGQLVFGPLGEAFGERRVLVVAGAVHMAVVALLVSTRAVRTLRRAREPVTPA